MCVCVCKLQDYLYLQCFSCDSLTTVDLFVVMCREVESGGSFVVFFFFAPQTPSDRYSKELGGFMNYLC